MPDGSPQRRSSADGASSSSSFSQGHHIHNVGHCPLSRASTWGRRTIPVAFAPAMRGVWMLLAVGLAGRLVLAFAPEGNGYDLMSFVLTEGAPPDGDPFALYAQVAAPPRWPYPPGYLPWVWAAPRVAFNTGLPFHGVIQLLPVLTDV